MDRRSPGELQLHDGSRSRESSEVSCRDGEISRRPLAEKQSGAGTDAGWPSDPGHSTILFAISQRVRGYQLWTWHVAVPHAAIHDAGRRADRHSKCPWRWQDRTTG